VSNCFSAVHVVLHCTPPNRQPVQRSGGCALSQATAVRCCAGDDKLLGTAACPFKPMEIIGEVNGDGLGMSNWWQVAADVMEE
jgi:hypothetical protein